MSVSLAAKPGSQDRLKVRSRHSTQERLTTVPDTQRTLLLARIRPLAQEPRLTDELHQLLQEIDRNSLQTRAQPCFKSRSSFSASALSVKKSPEPSNVSSIA